MTAEGFFVLGVIGLVTAALMSRRIGVDTAMVGGLLLLLLADQILGGDRILPIQDGLSGFSHKAVVMIGALYVVAAGLRETGFSQSCRNHVQRANHHHGFVTES